MGGGSGGDNGSSSSSTPPPPPPPPPGLTTTSTTVAAQSRRRRRRRAAALPAPRGSINYVGLENQGATCYLNALLQMMYMTPELRAGLYQVTPENLGYEAWKEQEKEEERRRQEKEEEEEEARFKAATAAALAGVMLVEADAGIMAQLIEMGFSEAGAERATLAGQKEGFEACLNWAMEHSEDVDFNTPVPGSRLVGTTSTTPATADMVPSSNAPPTSSSSSSSSSTTTTTTTTTSSGNKKNYRAIPLEMQRLFAQLQLADRRAISTDDLTSKGFAWHSWDGRVQHDVHELVELLLDALERSLVRTGGDKLVGNHFRGVQVDQVECSVCHTVSESQVDFLTIFSNVKGLPNLEAGLREAYVQPERLDGDNKYACGKCKCNTVAYIRHALRKAPPILLIALRAFDFYTATLTRTKITTNFTYPMHLDLRPYMEVEGGDRKGGGGSKDKKGKGEGYDLAGVIVHQGSAYEGHYHAYLKEVLKKQEDGAPGPTTTSWLNFDDSIVQSVTEQEVLRPHGKGSAYLLVYRQSAAGQVPQSLQEDGMLSPPQAWARWVEEENAALANARQAQEGAMHRLKLRVLSPADVRYEAPYLVALGHDGLLPAAAVEVGVDLRADVDDIRTRVWEALGGGAESAVDRGVPPMAEMLHLHVLGERRMKSRGQELLYLEPGGDLKPGSPFFSEDCAPSDEMLVLAWDGQQLNDCMLDVHMLPTPLTLVLTFLRPPPPAEATKEPRAIPSSSSSSSSSSFPPCEVAEDFAVPVHVTTNATVEDLLKEAGEALGIEPSELVLHGVHKSATFLRPVLLYSPSLSPTPSKAQAEERRMKEQVLTATFPKDIFDQAEILVEEKESRGMHNRYLADTELQRRNATIVVVVRQAGMEDKRVTLDRGYTAEELCRVLELGMGETLEIVLPDGEGLIPLASVPEANDEEKDTTTTTTSSSSNNNNNNKIKSLMDWGVGTGTLLLRKTAAEAAKVLLHFRVVTGNDKAPKLSTEQPGERSAKVWEVEVSKHDTVRQAKAKMCQVVGLVDKDGDEHRLRVTTSSEEEASMMPVTEQVAGKDALVSASPGLMGGMLVLLEEGKLASKGEIVLHLYLWSPEAVKSLGDTTTGNGQTGSGGGGGGGGGKKKAYKKRGGKGNDTVHRAVVDEELERRMRHLIRLPPISVTAERTLLSVRDEIKALLLEKATGMGAQEPWPWVRDLLEHSQVEIRERSGLLPGPLVRDVAVPFGQAGCVGSPSRSEVAAVVSFTAAEVEAEEAKADRQLVVKQTMENEEGENEEEEDEPLTEEFGFVLVDAASDPEPAVIPMLQSDNVVLQAEEGSNGLAISVEGSTMPSALIRTVKKAQMTAGKAYVVQLGVPTMRPDATPDNVGDPDIPFSSSFVGMHLWLQRVIQPSSMDSTNGAKLNGGKSVSRMAALAPSWPPLDMVLGGGHMPTLQDLQGCVRRAFGLSSMEEAQRYAFASYNWSAHAWTVFHDPNNNTPVKPDTQPVPLSGQEKDEDKHEDDALFTTTAPKKKKKKNKKKKAEGRGKDADAVVDDEVVAASMADLRLDDVHNKATEDMAEDVHNKGTETTDEEADDAEEEQKEEEEEGHAPKLQDGGLSADKNETAAAAGTGKKKKKKQQHKKNKKKKATKTWEEMGFKLNVKLREGDLVAALCVDDTVGGNGEVTSAMFDTAFDVAAQLCLKRQQEDDAKRKAAMPIIGRRGKGPATGRRMMNGSSSSNKEGGQVAAAPEIGLRFGTDLDYFDDAEEQEEGEKEEEKQPKEEGEQEG